MFGLEPNEPNPAKHGFALSQLTNQTLFFFSSKLALLERLALTTDAGADKGAAITCVEVTNSSFA